MSIPSGLGNHGRRLYSSIVGDWELTDREAELLLLAARQADDVARLETAIRKHGTMVRGSTGQVVLNPAVGEARQGRMAIGRLLAQLNLQGDEDEVPQTAASKRAQ